MRGFLKLATLVLALVEIVRFWGSARESPSHPQLLGQVSVILLSGGVGSRFGAPVPKQYVQLAGRPVAVHSFSRLVLNPYCKEIIVVCETEYEPLFRACYETLFETGIAGAPPLRFARPGTSSRQESMANGLQRVEGTLVAVHDSARPLIRAVDFQRVCEDAAEFGAAVLAVPVKSTIKQDDQDMFVDKTPDRRLLWEAQTPQVFRTALLRSSVARGWDENITDDASLVERESKVRITPGDYGNIKITTPEDLAVAETLLRSQQQT